MSNPTSVPSFVHPSHKEALPECEAATALSDSTSRTKTISPPTNASLPTDTSKDLQSKETSVGDLSSKLADTTMLDMVFVMDATGSMSSYIAAAQKTIKDIVQEIVSTEKADVRFALISYRDHPPQDDSYVITEFPFSSSTRTMRENLDKISASGGGDTPEAVVDGLHAASKLAFRDNATKVCILIADAPPHGLRKNGDGFPNGCPCGLDPITVCRNLAEQGVTLYCIGCEPSISPYKSFFMAMAAITGGQYCPMGSSHTLSQAVVSGVREEISLERLWRDTRSEIDECKDMSEEEQVRLVQMRFSERGVKTRQMKSDVAMPEMTKEAIAMSKTTSLADARKHCETADRKVYEVEASLSSPKMKCAPKSAKAGLFSILRTSLSAPRSASSRKEAAVDAVDHREHLPASPAAEAATPAAYYSVEDAASYSQCARLVSKSRARK